MSDPRPVVTMEGTVWTPVDDPDDIAELFIDGELVAEVMEDSHGKPYIVPRGNGWIYATGLRAIADFLDQLEGADLLSQVTE